MVNNGELVCVAKAPLRCKLVLVMSFETDLVTVTDSEVNRNQSEIFIPFAVQCMGSSSNEFGRSVD